MEVVELLVPTLFGRLRNIQNVLVLKILLCFNDILTVHLLNNNAQNFVLPLMVRALLVLCATQFYGDGSNLCNINAGFDPDSRTYMPVLILETMVVKCMF